MDGEFVCEATIGMTKNAVGGGNLFIMGASSAKRAQRGRGGGRRCIGATRDVIMPFPGGIVRSGSKVGSKYRALARLDQ